MKSKYFIISAPSGSGKSSLANYLLSKEDSLAFSISSTTRNRREKEINGVNYYFISKEQFKEHIKLKDFIEWEQVYTDDYKGTLKSEINRLVSFIDLAPTVLNLANAKIPSTMQGQAFLGKELNPVLEF